MRTFFVEGAGAFPFDLLRRDRCWPATAEDARSIGTPASADDPQSTRLRSIRLATDADHAPNRARWRRKGWRVID